MAANFIHIRFTAIAMRFQLAAFTQDHQHVMTEHAPGLHIPKHTVAIKIDEGDVSALNVVFGVQMLNQRGLMLPRASRRKIKLVCASADAWNV